MTIKYSVNARNDQLDAIETLIGTSPKLRFYTGAPPTNPSDAATGTLLCEIALPSDWMAAASAGVKAKSGTWSGTCVATGTVGYFRLYDNAGTTCHMQGTCGTSGDLVVDNAALNTGQTLIVNSFAITGGNP